MESKGGIAKQTINITGIVATEIPLDDKQTMSLFTILLTICGFTKIPSFAKEEIAELEEENKKLKETIKDHQFYEEKLEHRIIEFEELLH